jgi:hypothetical protein
MTILNARFGHVVNTATVFGSVVRFRDGRHEDDVPGAV